MLKRPAQALVSYASSDDDAPPPEAAPKKRKLPPLSSSIAPPAPVDNPALHQGRLRASPYVEGQWAAHVYVSVPLRAHRALHKLVQDVLADARRATPSLHDIWPEGAGAEPELHISLSRPIYLRAHQREDLKRAVKNMAKAHKAFIVSFATLSELINDEKTRTFLTLEVGAGYHELRSLADALTPALQAIRQQEYYENPRFHASIGWALLQRASDSQPARSDSICTARAASEGRPTQETPADQRLRTIAKLCPEAIRDLNARYGAALCSPRIEVESISLKIGKDVCTWRLIGM